MQYEYGGWTIDATPDYSLGKFFAHARLTRASPDSGTDSEMHIERDIAWFDSEDEAVQCARQWAMVWIDERNGRIASAPADRAASRNHNPATSPAK
ncbi:hypothetical protein [Paraburkholderia sp. BL10I2N1]|uniref:hypothetical protein n=1 Tax=Paraburkholderia sp. BL10I2N1 TaxID=1938796 RepID=UPI00105CD66A|nr:hypothetical protein [Paraburkholderia sp. BL10I2N1]TDN70218.1 hypothetical protein B0G77_3676 [Paraburkholderia sp. BL10I2N1]